jgi:hypothetical protein
MTVTELELRLVELGRELDMPEAPDLAEPVRVRIEPRSPSRRPPRWALAAALVVLAALAATLAIPPARSAFLRVLHLGGAEISIVDEVPAVTPQLNLDLALGQRISLATARRGAGFQLRELDEAPNAVYRSERGTIWFLYGRPSKVRLLVAQTRGGFDPDLMFKKLAAPDTHVRIVDVNGSRGAYISGRPHLVMLLDRDGEPIAESTRLARNVLIWASDGVAFRLEGRFSETRALELARALR